MKKPAVFLDRDGVINNVFIRNGKSYPPPSLAEYRILEGVVEAIEGLKLANLLTIVVTNQPDVGNGIQAREVVENMHRFIGQTLQLDDIYVCYHRQIDNCTCRKPRPGMLLEAAAKWSVNLPQSYMVGDRWSDIIAGEAAGCQTILIGSGYPQEAPQGVIVQPKWNVVSLFDASKLILQSLS